MHRVVVHPLRISGQEIEVEWQVEPAGLYRASRFRLGYPSHVAVAEVPDALWWTVVLLCLHPHWLVLRPCRVELPITLGPGEREFWLRLLDAGAQTLEAYRGGDPGRSIEIVEGGPSPVPVPASDSGAVATAFSGGKDSLLQLALLTELVEEVIAVTTTAPLPPMQDHLTPRRREVLAEVSRRRAIEHVEVQSDARACVDNDAPLALGYPVTVNELADTFLYTAAMLPVAWLRGAARVFLASEAEVQETVVRDGQVVQHPHFMYSAATQRAVSGLLARHGLALGALTYPLRSGQVQRLLWTRYGDVRDLQYSCWRVGTGEATCSACSQCLRISLSALASGGSPAEMGIDLPKLLLALRDWSPAAPSGSGLPDDRVKRDLHAQIVRDLAVIPARRIARHLPPRRSSVAALRAYRRLRARVTAAAPRDVAPGYRGGYLELVDERLRDGVASIYDGAFARGPADADRDLVRRTRALSDWIAEPLAR